MFVRELISDRWVGTANYEKVIKDPAVSDVKQAILNLDARSRSLVLITTACETHMAVGGGNGQYVVYSTVDNLEFNNLIDIDAGQEEICLSVGGQEGNYQARQIVSKEVALKAALTFFKTGLIDPSLSWEVG